MQAFRTGGWPVLSSFSLEPSAATADVIRDVEKLFPAKFAKIKSRQDALQATFSVFLDISYLPNFGGFEENGLFQHPQAFTHDSASERPTSGSDEPI
jgi:hypothetical protein